MKKFFVSVLCILTLLLVPINASAEDIASFETAASLYEYWTSENCLPSFITGVWSTDGGSVNLTFGVTNDAAGREGAKQILELVANDSTVAIAYQTYGLNYLYGIQSEVEPYLSEDIGFKAVGVYFGANRVEVDVAQSRMDDPVTSAVVEDLTGKYGAAIFFRFTNSEYVTTGGNANGSANGFLNPIHNQNNVQSPLLFGMFAVCIVSFVALFFSEYRRRKLLIFLIGKGTVVTPYAKASSCAIENTIRNSFSSPSVKTEASIQTVIKQISEKTEL